MTWLAKKLVCKTCRRRAEVTLLLSSDDDPEETSEKAHETPSAQAIPKLKKKCLMTKSWRLANENRRSLGLEPKWL